jgi:hypothetical protein
VRALCSNAATQSAQVYRGYSEFVSSGSAAQSHVDAVVFGELQNVSEVSVVAFVNARILLAEFEGE